MIKNYNETAIGNTLRQPRNLVHPMREIRKLQTVTEHTASVSLSMIKSALDELSKLPEPVYIA